MKETFRRNAEISRLAGKAEELNPNTGCLHPSIQKEPVQRSPTRWSLRKASRPRRTHRRGLSRVSRLRDRPQLRLRADKLPSPNHCEGRDFLLVFKTLSLSPSIHVSSRTTLCPVSFRFLVPTVSLQHPLVLTVEVSPDQILKETRVEIVVRRDVFRALSRESEGGLGPKSAIATVSFAGIPENPGYT